MSDTVTKKPKTKTKKGKKAKAKKKPPRATKSTPDEDLTPEQLYQREYYRKKREERAQRHAERWEKDKEYREREVNRQRRKRQEAREAAAEERFKRRVERKRRAAKPTRRPKYVELGNGQRAYVYGTGSMAREVGREDATIRAWLAAGILPGASIWIGRRAHFTPEFIKAVRGACKRMLTEDGRGDNDRLRELVAECLSAEDIFYEEKRRG